MHFLKLILRNTLRHKLRTGLTVLGLVVAIIAFGLLRTVVDAWYAGAEGASSTRLVTRNAISLVFPLPVNYQAHDSPFTLTESQYLADSGPMVSFGDTFSRDDFR